LYILKRMNNYYQLILLGDTICEACRKVKKRFFELLYERGLNKQLAHYASGISKPRPRQAQKIAQGLQRLAHEMMVVTV